MFRQRFKQDKRRKMYIHKIEDKEDNTEQETPDKEILTDHIVKEIKEIFTKLQLKENTSQSTNKKVKVKINQKKNNHHLMKSKKMKENKL